MPADLHVTDQAVRAARWGWVASSRVAATFVVAGLPWLVAGCQTASTTELATEEPADAALAPGLLVRHEVDHAGQILTVWAKRPADPAAAIVIVHGSTWSALPNFDLQVDGEERSFLDGLVERNIAAYAVDLRGYGQSHRDADGFVDPDEAAGDLLEVLRFVRQREDATPAVFGWSLGAFVAQLAVQREPAAASHLVLCGWPGDDFAFEQMPTSPSPRREPTTAEQARSDFVVRGAISERAIEAYVRAALAADPIRADWTGWQVFADDLDVSAVTTPVLILRGALDPLATADSTAFDRSGASEVWEVIMPGCGHAVFLERGRAACLDAIAGLLVGGEER